MCDPALSSWRIRCPLVVLATAARAALAMVRTRLAVDVRQLPGNSAETPFGEIAGWLTEAGFTNPRRLPAPSPAPLVPATRIDAGLLL